MTHKSLSNLRVLLIRYGPRLALLALPLLVNALIWKSFTHPQQLKLQEWRDKHLLSELRPKLETILGEGDELLAGRRHETFSKDDPSAAMQTIERFAGHHRLEIKEIHLNGEELQRQSVLSLSLNLNGGFDRLARWMSDVEAHPGFQINSWTLAAAKGREAHQLNVDLTVFLRETP